MILQTNEASAKRPTRLTMLLMLGALLLAAILTAGTTGGRASANYLPGEFPEAQLRQYLDHASRTMGLPALSVEVSYQGDTVFEYARGKGVTTDTLSYIGSISKSFTALAIMQLAESGRIELDAPVSRYLTEFRVSDQITVQHLLNQVGGMTDLDYMPDLPVDASFDDLIGDMNNIPLRHVPGETFAYFNQNYSLLGAMVEKVSGQTYEAYVEEHILIPLGLERTYLRGEVDVTGHMTAFAISIPRHEPFLRYDLPGGYITSTVTDMVTYLDLLSARDARLGVSPEGIDMMMHSDPYGMGWITGSVAGRPAVYHGGSLPGYVANSVMLTEDGYNIAILTNKNHLFYSLFLYPDLTSGIVSIITGQQPPSRAYLAWILRALLLVAIVNILVSFKKSLRLIREARPMQRTKRLAKIAINLAIPVALVSLIPVIAAFVLGRGITWPLAFAMMPDMFIWMALGMLTHLVDSVVHLYLLARVDR
ncbi:MAG TPA: serine hydrolase domain-containing protein [Bacillota bacterium]|nr:serine hydrolase domain-containing protein [Bacillota bacterium]